MDADRPPGVFLTPAEVADRLRLSVATVRRRIADGTLPSTDAFGPVRVPEAALIEIQERAIHGRNIPAA